MCFFFARSHFGDWATEYLIQCSSIGAIDLNNKKITVLHYIKFQNRFSEYIETLTTDDNKDVRFLAQIKR